LEEERKLFKQSNDFANSVRINYTEIKQQLEEIQQPREPQSNEQLLVSSPCIYEFEMIDESRSCRTRKHESLTTIFGVFSTSFRCFIKILGVLLKVLQISPGALRQNNNVNSRNFAPLEWHFRLKSDWIWRAASRCERALGKRGLFTFQRV
jgi:hypothetical protein